MGRIAVVGPWMDVAGYAMTGALVVAADDDATARQAWRSLPDDVDVVVLSPGCAAALGVGGGLVDGVMVVVTPP